LPNDNANEHPHNTFDQVYTGDCPPGISPMGRVFQDVDRTRVIARGEILALGKRPDEGD